jgi:hypothetical protein
MLEISRPPATLYFQSMNGISVRYGRGFVASVMFLLVGVVALSTATRQPCFRAYSGPWHTYKAGRMTQPEQHKISVSNSAESAEVAVAETKTLPPRYVPHEEILPIALPLTVQKHHFRSPPLLQ